MNHGADVNCVSDTGSTPVRSACFMTHLEIVRLLVKYSANIQRSVRANNEYITTTTYLNTMTPHARDARGIVWVYPPRGQHRNSREAYKSHLTQWLGLGEVITILYGKAIYPKYLFLQFLYVSKFTNLQNWK